MKNIKAFTLVELAIVIVIIGLLVGGVLQGQELIKQAQQRRIISNIESYKAAIIGFKGKYNCLPGDCNNHARYFGATAGIVEGDNNGLIDIDSEVFEIWRALGLANFVQGSYRGYQGTNILRREDTPVDSANQTYIYRCMPLISNIYGRRFCGFWVASYSSAYMRIDLSGNAIMSPNDAKAFDFKYDDGIAYTGKILGVRESNKTNNHCTDLNAYTNSTTVQSEYLQHDNKECVIVFENSF
jgi:prepilin-type N-terminal cleavage/methylation domain-containing protein